VIQEEVVEDIRSNQVFGFLCYLIIGCAFEFWCIGLKNTEQRQRNAVTAEQDACKIKFDAVWKILQDQAGVTDEYKDAFKEIFVEQANARYGKDSNVIFKMITESNPTFSIELFAKLMTSIEAQRTAFEFEQKKLISINQVHTDFVTTFPGSILGKEIIEITLVTSKRTKKAYETGEDNETLFEKKQKEEPKTK
jgi:hypothetical protein